MHSEAKTKVGATEAISDTAGKENNPKTTTTVFDAYYNRYVFKSLATEQFIVVVVC